VKKQELRLVGLGLLCAALAPTSAAAEVGPAADTEAAPASIAPATDGGQPASKPSSDKPSNDLTVDNVTNIARTPVLARPSSGPDVLRAQVLLDRAHFSPGELDAVYGRKMLRAVSGFQRSRGLKATGVVDIHTWAALHQDTAPVLARYVITAEDVAGPFTQVPEDMMEKSALAALAYGSPAETLGERFHASPELLRRLNAGKELGRAGEELVVPNVGNTPPLPAAVQLVVDQSDLTVSLADVAGKIYAQFPASIGSERDPLPIGRWKIRGIARDPPFHYNPKLFWDADEDHAKARIAPGPNNPVGVVWIDLSIDHYGIHGTPEPASIGKTQSHGCIRLSNWDAQTVASAVSPGLPALLRR
jgi:lipoprotein-anchoring transpeptidase ErfK/SrfK